MDLVFGYPDEKTVYIGFFMVDRQLQGKGTGSLIISHTADILQRQSYRFMKLAWVEGNRQSEHFWRKNGFEPNGSEYSCAGVPLFRRNGYRQSSGRKPLIRNRDTTLN
ncbi:MAG: GNAT family N-acetyltransferase [Lacrimispora saccharolytica]